MPHAGAVQPRAAGHKLHEWAGHGPHEGRWRRERHEAAVTRRVLSGSSEPEALSSTNGGVCVAGAPTGGAAGRTRRAVLTAPAPQMGRVGPGRHHTATLMRKTVVNVLLGPRLHCALPSTRHRLLRKGPSRVRRSQRSSSASPCTPATRRPASATKGGRCKKKTYSTEQ